jgi:hypothetical protein
VFKPTRQQRRTLEKENLKWPLFLQRVPPHEWPDVVLSARNIPFEVWRSRAFLVQLFIEAEGIFRISVCRTSHNGERWDENISWDGLQRLKAEAGFAGQDAVEVYPNERDVVNVANMRHLWVLPVPLAFAWRKKA